VSISVEGEIPPIQVRANQMLSSVFRNHFQNAIRHNDTEIPEILFSADETDEKAVVCIADNGPGVPDVLKNTLFEKGKMRVESDGTGIGLYLVKALIQTYNGDVLIKDNGPEGAVFVVELPTSATDSFS